MGRDEPLSKCYITDPSTNHYLIEIGLDQYADIFSEWDPAPFKRRAIDPDLELYLEESCDEIPARLPIGLRFILPEDRFDPHLEAETRQGFKNSLVFKQYLLKKELRRTNAKMLQFVLIGLLLLAWATLFSDTIKSVVLTTLIEGLFIAGWVFLWEAVSLFFFTNRELYHRYRIYRKLQNAPLLFQAKETLAGQ